MCPILDLLYFEDLAGLEWARTVLALLLRQRETESNCYMTNFFAESIIRVYSRKGNKVLKL